jgi:tetratricopeptide (TPR) repeat protein
VLAIYAFVLDWNASSNLLSEQEREDLLNKAQTQAARAFSNDPNNALALAFYAEVLLDQQRWAQAEQYAEQARELAPDSMDVRRVYAVVLESTTRYNEAIEEYLAAAELTPNFTYLYMRVGVGYRNLGNRAALEEQRTALYELALTYFDRAASINQQIGVRDPQPYIAIANTYALLGDFFTASRNGEKALKFDPTNPFTYGQLGNIYVQARNYEYALPPLQCAIEGCTAIWLAPPDEPNSLNAVRCKELTGCGEQDEGAAIFYFGRNNYTRTEITIEPLPITNLTIAYYYIRYGSVLGYLNRPNTGYCEKSLALMQTLRESDFGEDVFLLQNIEATEALCTP